MKAIYTEIKFRALTSTAVSLLIALVSYKERGYLAVGGEGFLYLTMLGYFLYGFKKYFDYVRELEAKTDELEAKADELELDIKLFERVIRSIAVNGGYEYGK